MNVQWLDDVLVLLEEGNMTRAAARRNITQPAFSRRIRNFEDWLGTTALERGTNKVEISPALRSSEADIRALVARIRDLRSRITHFDPAQSTVTIAAQHTPVFSTFPDMALRAKARFRSLNFRLRAGNLRDCVTLFLRGDADMLLCYESRNTGSLPFGQTIRRAVWGLDYLVPVVGGSLRYKVRDNGEIPTDTPAIVFPDNSYFGEVLNAGGRMFGTQAGSKNALCETAFSMGIKEMALKGLGVGWLPFSIAHREIETGELISLANFFGREELEVAIYGNLNESMTAALLDLWRGRQG